MTLVFGSKIPLRVYIDTSVIGGCFDEEFEADSRRLFELTRQGKLTLLVSEVVVSELQGAPENVKKILDELPPSCTENVEVTEDVLMLGTAYIRAGVVGARWADDAAHVAAATVARADAIVSWNFKHIVRLDKIKAYNQVNLALGYGILTIVSPREVSYDDETGDKNI